MKKLLFGAVAAASLVGMASASHAAVLLSAGQFGGIGVHSTAGLSATSVTGAAGSDLVTISTDGNLSGDKLDTSGGGESVYAADFSHPAHFGVMDDITIAFTNHYQAVTFNLNIPNQVTTAFNLVVNGGAFSFSQSGLGNGQNKFRLDASGGDFIQTLAFTFTGGLVQDIREIRVQPFDVVTPGVPEPATWAMMLMGFGGLGAMLRRRRAVVA